MGVAVSKWIFPNIVEGGGAERCYELNPRRKNILVSFRGEDRAGEGGIYPEGFFLIEGSCVTLAETFVLSAFFFFSSSFVFFPILNTIVPAPDFDHIIPSVCPKTPGFLRGRDARWRGRGVGKWGFWFSGAWGFFHFLWLGYQIEGG